MPYLAVLQNSKIFLEKKHLFLLNYPNFERFENSWAMISIEMHSRIKNCTYSEFDKFQAFFWKNPSFFRNKPKYWTFWEIILLQSHSRARLLKFSEKDIRWETQVNVVFRAGSIGKHQVKNARFWQENFAFRSHIL